MAVKMCSSCGYVIADPSRPCPSCGAELPLSAQDPLQPQPRGRYTKKLIAILLCSIILLESVVIYRICSSLYSTDTETLAAIAFEKFKNVFAGAPEQNPEQKAPAPEQPARRAAMSDADFIELCGSGSLQEISDAIQNGANVNAKTADEMDQVVNTPLMAAVRSNFNAEIVTALLKAGADVNARDKYGRTPLILVMEDSVSPLNMIKPLIEAGADVNARDKDDRTPLMLVMEKPPRSNIKMIEVRNKTSADFNARHEDDKTPLTGKVRVVHYSALHYLEIVKPLIEAGADVNVRYKNGWSPLMHAITRNDDDVAMVLIEAGADVNVRGNEGNTPLMLAAALLRFNDKLITALIKAGADTNEGDAGIRLLMRAAYEGSDPAAVAALLNAGTDVNAIDEENGRTPLMLAGQYNTNAEVIKALINAGADVNAIDKNGRTPLMFAVSGAEAAKLLIEAGAYVNARDDEDRTALMLAAERANPEVITALIKAGAHVNARDIYGNTTLLFAAQHHSNDEEVTALLVKTGADANAIDNEGSTAYAKIIVTGDNVNIRSLPSLKGEVRGRADSGQTFIAGSAPVRDAAGSAEWYRILFTIDEASGEIFRASKLSDYWYSSPYISARFAKRAELSRDEKDQLDFYLSWPALIKLEAAGVRESLALREQPSANSKIITELSEESLSYGCLYAKPTPIKSGGVSWYEVQFIGFWGETLQAKYYEHNDSNSAYFYVNAKEVRQAPLDVGDQDFLNRFDRGRPLMFGIGDDLARVEKLTSEGGGFRSAETKIPLTLYLEPDEGAETFTLPAGSLIIDWTPASVYVTSNPSPLLGDYIDMRDNSWVAIIDAQSRKVIGWYDYLYDNEIFPSPPYSSPGLENWDKIFIY